MPPVKVSVNFTETFLGSSRGTLDDDDLRSIALQLSIDPSAGKLVEGVPYLRKVSRVSINTGIKYCVWFLSFPDAPQVEVVGFSTGRAIGTTLSRKTVWRILKLAMFLRIARKAYEFATDHLVNVF
jgi:hypothetical protein